MKPDIKDITAETYDYIFRQMIEDRLREKFQEIAKPIIDAAVKRAAEDLEVNVKSYLEVHKDRVVVALTVNDKQVMP